MKTALTKDEVVDALKPYIKETTVPIEIGWLIMAIEREFYSFHIDNIQKRQDKLTKLWQDENRFLAIWNGDKDSISPGCYNCLYGNIDHVRHSSECTQKCSFCYYRHAPPEMPKENVPKNTYFWSISTKHPFTLDEMKLQVDRQAVGGKNPVTAIGWLQKEPLMELEALQPLMKYIAKKGIHQYLYTNGVFANVDTLKIVADCGLNEIRFNLEATNFADHIITRMGEAVKLIEWVLIESPIYSNSFNNYLQKIDKILDTGLNQINMAELQVCHPESAEEFIASEGTLYAHRRGYVSPISSRHYTYTLIEKAELENWPVIINDCSNDTKYFRGVKPLYPIGNSDYNQWWQLGTARILKLVDIIFQDGVERKFL